MSAHSKQMNTIVWQRFTLILDLLYSGVEHNWNARRKWHACVMWQSSRKVMMTERNFLS